MQLTDQDKDLLHSALFGLRDHYWRCREESQGSGMHWDKRVKQVEALHQKLNLGLYFGEK